MSMIIKLLSSRVKTTLILSFILWTKCFVAWAAFPEHIDVVTHREGPEVVKMIHEATSLSIAGSFKIYDKLATSASLERAFCANNHWYVGTEKRISAAEKRATAAVLDPLSHSDPIHSLDQHPEMVDRVFSFENCQNAHLKFFLTPDLLLVGTTNLDDQPRTKDGQVLKTWYGLPSYKVDFLVVIRDKRMIHQFVQRLSHYLPDALQQKLKSQYTCDLTDSDVTASYAAQFDAMIHENDTQSQLKTMFLWGAEEHRNILFKMINRSRKEIAIYQQDLTDVQIQEALYDAAKRGVQLRIIMSRYPFVGLLNPAIPFLKRLGTVGPNVRYYLTCDKDPTPIHIHAKFMKADDIAYIGSANFYKDVLERDSQHLNVGIVTRDDRYIHPIMQQFVQNEAELMPTSLVA